MNIIILSAILILGACDTDNPIDKPVQPDPEPATKVELSIVDKKSTDQTKALYSQLWAIQSKGFMFGHHDDLFYGRKWFNVPGGSDTKDVCGDYPAVFSVDFAEIMDDRSLARSNSNDIRRRCIIEARERGEVITACCHLNNPLTGDSWDNSNINVVKEILKDGSQTNLKFKVWLDRLAKFALELKDSKEEIRFP